MAKHPYSFEPFLIVPANAEQVNEPVQAGLEVGFLHAVMWRSRFDPHAPKLPDYIIRGCERELAPYSGARRATLFLHGRRHPQRQPYASSSRPAASSSSSSASAAWRLASLANTYSLIFGSVPLGRTMTLLPPSTSNSTTLAEGRPFTPP